MNYAQAEFLRILNNYLHSQSETYMISPEILEYAKSQEVEGIIYKQTKNPSQKSKYVFAVYTYVNRVKLIEELEKLLYSIPHFYVKGLQIAKYYPDPCLRTMGDVDLIVKSEDLDLVKSIFVDNGFTIGKVFESEVLVYKSDFQFEIHTSLIHSGIGNEKAMSYFENCWKYVRKNVLNDSYHFVFIMQHLKGHMVSKGVGFRHFLDVALLSQQPELDWEWICEEFVKLDLLEFAKTVFAFNKKWFGIIPPMESNNIDETFFREATEKIFNGGVFGHEDDSTSITNIK